MPIYVCRVGIAVYDVADSGPQDLSVCMGGPVAGSIVCMREPFIRGRLPSRTPGKAGVAGAACVRWTGGIRKTKDESERHH
jgi:hypothetical protein